MYNHGEIEGELRDEANVADACKGAISFDSTCLKSGVDPRVHRSRKNSQPLQKLMVSEVVEFGFEFFFHYHLIIALDVNKSVASYSWFDLPELDILPKSKVKDTRIDMAIYTSVIGWIVVARSADWKPVQFLSFAFVYRIFEKLKGPRREAPSSLAHSNKRPQKLKATNNIVVQAARNLSAAGIMFSVDPFIIGLQLNHVPMSLPGIIIPSANDLKVTQDTIEKKGSQFRENSYLAFGGNTRDLGSFGEETDDTTDLHQHLSRLCSQRLETASQDTRDAVTIHPTTVSQEFTTASARTTHFKI
ncbi:RNA-directed DNA polymerase, eukaryota, reverse transcriptase zinc-binding domain protein [Tanacetum coccineum]